MDITKILEQPKKWLQNELDDHKKWLQNKEGGVRADLRGADLSHTNLSYTDLSYTYLIRTNLTHTNLTHTNLTYTDLRHSDLRYTDLRRTNLYRTNLRHADLRGTNLDFSQLNLSCDGLDFKIDEKIAKQITYHLLNLMQTSNLDTSKIFKKSVYNWVNSSHLIYEHGLDKIEEI